MSKRIMPEAKIRAVKDSVIAPGKKMIIRVAGKDKQGTVAELLHSATTPLVGKISEF